MNATPNVTKEVTDEEYDEWRANHVTRDFLKSLNETLKFESESFTRGELLDSDSQTRTFGNLTRLTERIELLNKIIDFISERKPKNE